MKSLLFLPMLLAAVAAAQLNPTVQRLSRPSGPVPPECEQGLLPAPTPRIEVAEIPEPQLSAASAASLPPASRSLRAQLEEVRAAAERGDRPRFRDALAGAKATLAGYPAGGERTAAAAAVRGWEDVDRLWTYQFESPTGAFFDQSSDVYRIVSAYPGYEESIRRQTLTIGGRRIYPTVESRTLLVKRLTSGSMPSAPPAPTRVASGEPKPSPRHAAAHPRPVSRPPAVPHPHRKPTRVARAASPPVRRAPAPVTPPPAPAPAPAPVTPAPARRAPAPAPAPITPPPAPAPAPVTPAPAPAPAPVPPPVTTTTAAPEPAPAPVTATVATAAPAPEPVPATADNRPPATDNAKPKGRGMVLPIILILIGLGVLVVLFRASS